MPGDSPPIHASSSGRPRRRAAADAPQRRRAPGRPGADGPDQRERVLDAAIACYIKQGIAGTTLRQIAERAGVNPSLLHYYFGDKKGLRDAVIEARILPAFESLRRHVAGAGDDVPTLVAGFVAGVGALAKEHPWMPSLWVREVLCEGGGLRDVLFDRLGPQLPVMMAERFARASALGEINAGLDPRLLMVSLVGLTLFPVAGAPVWRQLFKADDLDFEALHRHTMALLEHGLAPPVRGEHA